MNAFSDLSRKLKKLPIQELRKESTGYLEFVLSAENLIHIYPLLEEYFGPPFKPAGVQPSPQASGYARRYGGIEKQQTLYYMENGALANCAMLWPWQDKTNTTVKVAQGEIPR